MDAFDAAKNLNKEINQKKYCTVCGNELNTDSSICMKCGCPVRSEYRNTNEDNGASYGCLALLLGVSCAVLIWLYLIYTGNSLLDRHKLNSITPDTAQTAQQNTQQEKSEKGSSALYKLITGEY